MRSTLALVDLKCSICKSCGQASVMLNVSGQHVETSPGAELSGWTQLDDWLICPRHRSILVTDDSGPRHIRIE